jgi:hypothetical protein
LSAKAGLLTPGDWEAMPPTLRVHVDWLVEQGRPLPTVRWVVQIADGRELGTDKMFRVTGRGKLFTNKAEAKAHLNGARRYQESESRRWRECLPGTLDREVKVRIEGWLATHETALAELSTARVVRVFQFPVRMGEDR